MNTMFPRGLVGLLLALLIPTLSFAQIHLKGTVLDEGGLPLRHARVYVDGTFASSVTDSLGHFALSYMGQLPLSIVATRSGYQPDTIVVDREPYPMLTMVLVAERRLPELVVSVSAIDIGGARRTPTLKPMDVYTNSAAAGDLALSLRQLPGVQDIGDREGFFVHGGDASEVVVSIEGIAIRNFWGKNTPYARARSRFPTGLFSGLSLATGGYQASEVGGLSGALRLGLEDKGHSSLSLGLTPLGANVGLGIPSRDSKLFTEHWVSFEGGEYLRLFLRPEYQILRPTYGANYIGRIVYTPTSRDYIKGMAMLSYDRTRLSLADPNPRYERMLYVGRDYYAFAMGRWQHENPSGSMLALSTGFEYDLHRLSTAYLLAPDHVYALDSQEQDAQLKLAYRRRLSSMWLALGVDYAYRYRSLQGISHLSRPLQGHSLEAYAEVGVPLSTRLSIIGGIRTLYQSLASGVALLPRLSLSWKPIAKHSMSLDIGKYAALDEYYQTYGHVPTERENAYQLNLSYEWRPARHHLIRLVAYDKEYRHLLIRQSLDAYRWHYQGRGYARGVDLLWRSTSLVSNVEYWLSYGYTDAQRMSLLSTRLEIPSYVARHTLSLVVKWWCAPLKSLLNATLAYRSGLTYHDPNRSEEGYYNARVPHRYSLDLSYNYPFRRGKVNGVVYIGALGLLSTDTPLGYRFSSERVGHTYSALAVTMPTRPMLMLGLYLNIGVDRRKDHLNTNLNIH